MSLPAILGAVSGLGGLFGGGASNVAKEQVRTAQNQQNAVIGRQTDAFDLYRSALFDAIRQGAFNPEQAIQQNHADAARNQEFELKNLAAAMAVAGYQAGETPLKNQIDQSMERNRAQVAAQDYAIRQNTLNQMLGAYAGLNQGSGSLNGALSTANGNYQTALQQQAQASAIQGQGLGAMVGAITPFLSSKSSVSTPTAPALKLNPVTPLSMGGGSGMFGQTNFGSGSLSTPSFGGGSGMFGDIDQFGSKPFNR